MTDIVTSELILSNKIPTLETIQLNNKLSKEQKKLLKNYKDKSLIISILAKRSYEFFSTIQSFVNIPLILSSTTLAILNSASLTGDAMKIPNIVINSVTGLTLALISNFKISDKVSIFKNLATKMNKLNNRMEEAIANDNITAEKLSSFIKEYETLQDTCDFSFPTSIKKKIYERYKNKGYILPNALIGFDDISIEDLNANNMNGSNNV
jgi:hypothetical protein|tara:strand:- start:7740 stop:8366 length:627 start_codon:yes stop_codon:yes gene_type:complete